MTKSKTLDDLELEATALGIHSITLVRKKQIWKATAFGRQGQCSTGEGEGVATAYEDLILKFRLRMQEWQDWALG